MTLDATRAWWEHPLVIVDFETTGADPVECGPVSVAAVRLEQGREAGHFYTLLRPGCPISEEAAKIHGITEEHVRDAPQLADVAPELCKLAAHAVPCGYNGETFDKLILHRFIAGADCPLFDAAQRWIDPLVIIRKIDRYVKGSGRHKLTAACERWGVPFVEGEAHNALADVRAVGRLLAELVRLGRVRPHVSLGRMLEYTARVRAEQDEQFNAYKQRVAAKESRAAQCELQLEPDHHEALRSRS